MPDFMPGTGDPTVTPDPGAGPWNVESMSVDTLAFRAAFFRFWPEALVVIGDDAVRHMFHYFRNTGADYTIDLEGMVNEVPSARLRYAFEVAAAKRYVQRPPVGTHQFTSQSAVNGYNRQGENRNWFFAIGGYSVWSKGTARVSTNASGQKGYEMDLEYKFFDRYNWDGGKSVTLFGVTVTDAFMDRMHREGIAREYNCHGSFRESFSWGASVAAASPPAGGSRGGR